jgi:hypothetical protein
VFPAPGGGRLTHFNYQWRQACRAAGVDRILHDFRRTAVRNFERAGVPRSAAMALTGHKTESVYRRYAITDSHMLEEAVVKLAAFHALETLEKGHTLATIRPPHAAEQTPRRAKTL